MLLKKEKEKVKCSKLLSYFTSKPGMEILISAFKRKNISFTIETRHLPTVHDIIFFNTKKLPFFYDFLKLEKLTENWVRPFLLLQNLPA